MRTTDRRVRPVLACGGHAREVVIHYIPGQGKLLSPTHLLNCPCSWVAQTCSAGFFGTAASYVTPVCGFSCPRGHFCPAATTVPLLCPPGKSMPQEGAPSESSCISCGAGEFNDQSGATSCTSCPAGRFNEEASRTSCVACPPGGYCPTAGAITRMVIVACSEGTYSSAHGMASNLTCQSCPRGKQSRKLERRAIRHAASVHRVRLRWLRRLWRARCALTAATSPTKKQPPA